MSPELAKFPSLGQSICFETRDLPPLDVLMIWHAFMLNSRDCLEDCIRAGYKNVWAMGMPWNIVDAVISTTFMYDPGIEAEATFSATTSRPWDNLQESPTKRLECLRCREGFDVVWSTCGSGSPDSVNKQREIHFCFWSS